ncbi:MAG TPA: response regulator [Bacteroidia bacterium]|jgi:DNA-binding response OmpR family regulator|nr:response regulator [Bacteroidia bacterium]
MSKEILFFVVDDDADDRDIFNMALGCIRHKTRCITAKSGEEALELLKKNEEFIPDFIFLDINMPRVNGKECLIEMRKMERLKKVPIYMYSTSFTDKDKVETLSLGATDYFVKPYSVKILIEILSKIILKKCFTSII